jgi:osmotically-inducible protein OsmY
VKPFRPIALTVVGLCAVALAGCSGVISATTDKPIESDPSSRSFGSMIDDSLIETTATVNIRKASPQLENAHVVPISYNGVLLLAGQVPTADARHDAAQAASRVKNVRRVHNHLTVEPNTELLIRSSDSLITSKIKGKFVSHKEVKSGKTKVVTENGVVYLMGLVTRSQGDLAAAIAQQTGGVQKVVTIFEYVDG